MSSAGGPTVGVVLAGACWAWAAGMEDIYQIFHFYPFGVPIAPRVLGVGGTELPMFGRMVGITDPCQTYF